MLKKASPPHIDHRQACGTARVYLAGKEPGFKFSWDDLNEMIRESILETVRARSNDPDTVINFTIVGDALNPDKVKVDILVGLDPHDPLYEEAVKSTREKLRSGKRSMSFLVGDLSWLEDLVQFMQPRAAKPSADDYSLARELIKRDKWKAKCFCQRPNCGVNTAIRELLEQRWDATAQLTTDAVRRIVADEMSHFDREQTMTLARLFRKEIKESPANRLAQAAINVAKVLLYSIITLGVLLAVVNFWKICLGGFVLFCILLFVFGMLIEDESSLDAKWTHLLVCPFCAGSRFSLFLTKIWNKIKPKSKKN